MLRIDAGRSLTVFLLMLAGTGISLAQTSRTHRKFNFGADRNIAGFNKVSADDIYNKDRGYGFEPGSNVICSDRGGKDRDRAGLCISDKPFYFSVTLPEGNYRVSITFGDKQSATSTTVKAELRRLMVEKVETKQGSFETRSFIVNVRTPKISTGDEVKLKDREKTIEWWAWDEKLTLEFNGSRPAVNAIEIEKVDVPTIFLLGDSTVSDQPREPYSSWGQMFTRFFAPKVAIANHAESGESLRSSLGAKRLDKVLSLMKPGDYLLIQYGHNDEKEKGQGVGAFTTFKASLKHFVLEARKKGGIPILLTPVQRRSFDADGNITNSHGDYPEAVRQVAKEETVPLIDLNAASKDLYEALGKDGSAKLFKEGDETHHNNFGSYELTKCIVQAIKDQRLAVAKYLIKHLPKFDPKKPDSFEMFMIPASPVVTNMKPLGS